MASADKSVNILEKKQQNCVLKKVKLGYITNSNGSATEMVDKKVTGVSGREVEGEGEIVGPMRYAVMLDGFPDVKMTEEQADKVLTALMEQINPSDRRRPIQFSAMQYENGGLALTCVNNSTKAWLFKTVYKIVPWPGAKLQVGQAEFILKGTKCILYMTRTMKKRSNQQILDLFQKQNRDISTAEWKVLRRVEEADKRERLTVWVDDKSLEDLQAHNFKLFLGLDQADLMLASEWKKMMNSCSSAEWHNPQPVLHNLGRRPPANYKPCQPVSLKFASKNFLHPLHFGGPELDAKLKKVKSGDITNTNDSVTEGVSKNEAYVLGRESEVKEEMFDWMRQAVVLEGFPDVKMTEEQAEMVATALIEWINLSDEGESIKFSEVQFECGGLVLTCVNEATKKWLKDTVRHIIPWPGARLALGQAELMLKGTRFILWVLKVMKRSNQQILDLFQKQNKGICTAEWKVLRRVAEGDKKTGLILWVDNKSDIPTFEWKVLERVAEADKRERLTLWIDNKSSEDLKARGFKLYLGLDQVKLMLASEWKKVMESCGSTRRTYKLRSLVPGLGPSDVSQSQAAMFSGPNRYLQFFRFEHQGQTHHRELKFDDTGPPQFCQTQFMTSDRLLAQEGMFRESAVMQNIEPRFLVSEQPHGHRFGMSEWSQSREASYIVPDRTQHTEPGYTLNRSQEYRYSTLDHQQLHVTGYKDQDLSEVREMRFMVSDQMHSKEGRLMEQDPLYSSESRLRLSAPQQFQVFDNTISRNPHSWEDRFSGQIFHPSN
ncbi:uncharacterized protein LOC126175980 [Schistocerca cancellata]|uniref:uncharacterized protein LOC126175980 n=1 Tax=Schistocerca cancellata TaxID=274614 RepID=UPI002118EBD1|nr:uncharacterized protein LOC126175980 [Schistocerca cancellata]